MKEFKRNCPECGVELNYCNKYALKYSIEKNTKCYSCNMKGRPCWNKGKSMTQEFKKSCSDGTKEKYKQGWSPRIGKYHTENTKEKMSKFHSGKILSEEHKLKLSKINTGVKNAFYGKYHTEEWKRKRRIQILKRMENLGIPDCEDKGSKEWFAKYNKETNSNFQPKTFWKWGYRADGYDKEKHIWIEYDTPYHRQPHQKKKDLIRQNNIIKYFEFIGKPLNQFTRIKVNKTGNLIETIQCL